MGKNLGVSQKGNLHELAVSFLVKYVRGMITEIQIFVWQCSLQHYPQLIKRWKQWQVNPQAAVLASQIGSNPGCSISYATP